MRGMPASMLCFCLAAVVFDHQHARAQSTWGTVTGQVVFSGNVNDLAVRGHIEDVKIYERQTIRDSLDNVPRRVLGTAHNYALLIDKETRGVSNAFVYLRRKPARVDPALVEKNPKPLELVYRDNLFFPRAFIVQAGQTVRLQSTKEAADFSIQSPNNDIAHPLVTPQKPVDWTPTKADPIPIRIVSNVHPAAISWCLVAGSPYAVLTDSKGKFQLKNLPTGELELTVWHETVGYVVKSLPVTVRAGQIETLPPVKLTAEIIKAR
jgi:hypothetical protein